MTTQKEFEESWDALFQQNDFNRLPASLRNGDDHDDEAFDCSALAVPPRTVLVDETVNEFVTEWRDLDERKLVAEGTTGSNWWYDRHVRLPQGFDYTTSQAGPPSDDGTTGERVLSLEDPTATKSYETELWKLFERVPTAEQLETQAIVGCALPNTKRILEEIAQGGGKTDAHSLSRLRICDRHDAPTLQHASGAAKTSTIRFECWRREPKVGMAQDDHRMIVEFAAGQTLQDLHDTIVEHANDSLWTTGGTSRDELEPSSGFFFIEDAFFTTGSVDYVGPIQDWLHSSLQHRARIGRLGLSSSDEQLSVTSMRDTNIEDVPLRLGIRYVHVHNGDVEVSVIAVDRRIVPASKQVYPICHDVWRQAYVTPGCDSCKRYQAVIVSSQACEITGGHRALCEGCSHRLSLQEKAPELIQHYATWRGGDGLTAAASQDKFV